MTRFILCAGLAAIVLFQPLEAIRVQVMISPNLAGWGPALLRRGYISCGYAGNDGMDDAAARAQQPEEKHHRPGVELGETLGRQPRTWSPG